MLNAHARSNSEQGAELRTRQHLTVDEVAELLRVSRWSIGRYIRRGELRATKAKGPNGAVRIPLDAYDEFLRSHTVQPDTEEK